MRDSKKSARRTVILNTALELFSKQGFESTSMARIAEKSGLGTGTLYNYFKTKNDILFSIIESRSLHYLNQLDKILIRSDLDLFQAISMFHDQYLQSFSIYSKRIWRECLSLIFSGKAELLRNIHSIDRPYIERLISLLDKHRNKNEFAKDADIEHTVTTLYAANMYAILAYIAADSMSLGDLKEQLANQVKTLIKAS